MEVDEPTTIRPLRQTEASEARLLWRSFHDASTRDEFQQSWLAIQCGEIEGVAAGLLLTRTRRSTSWRAAAHWPADRQPGGHVRAAAERVLKARRALALELDAQGAEPPRTIVGSPVVVDDEVIAVVVLDLTPRPQPELEAALRRLSWGSAWLELAAHREASGDSTAALLDLLATALEHDRFKAAASAFVTGLATRFHCDRVSFGVVRKERATLATVSHAASFDRRSNVARAIEATMDEAIDLSREVVWSADSKDRTSRPAHAALAAVSGADALCTFLVARDESFCAAVTLERRTGEPFAESELDLVDVAVDMVGPILDLQRREDRSIARKNAEALRNLVSHFLGPRHVALKLAAALSLAAIAFLALATGSYRVTGDVVLEAQTMRAAVAPFDGYIVDAPLRAGDITREGDVLALLDDRDLSLEKARHAAQLEELDREYRQALGERDAPRVRILTARSRKVQAQHDLASDQLARTAVKAPFDGIVVSGDRSQQLGSPVERGEVLFEVAPLDAYRAVVLVDERDVDEIAVGQRGSLVFAAFPEAPVAFAVEKITPVAEAREGINAFRVEARLDETPEGLRPGLEGVAKIDIDERRLIWIWTHRGVDWLRLFAWTWLP